MAERMRLYAVDADDLNVISALMQDAAIPAQDIAYDARARRLILMGSRYCWERKQRTRVRTVLRIEGAQDVKRKNWPAANDAVLDLLALRFDNGVLSVDFADDISIRARLESIDIEMHDLAGPWGAKRRPRHTL